jgi:inosine-uridine nucleoside N-ribohydrolase
MPLSNPLFLFQILYTHCDCVTITIITLCRETYGMDGIYVHDASALAAAVRPDLFEWHDLKVLVVTDGPARGRTIVDDGKRSWRGPNGWTGLPRIKVAMGVNSEEATTWVLDRMTR